MENQSNSESLVVPAFNVRSLRQKRILLELLCLSVLGCATFCLYQATVGSSDWFRLTLTSPTHLAEQQQSAAVTAPPHLSPWSYSIVALGSSSLIKPSTPRPETDAKQIGEQLFSNATPTLLTHNSSQRSEEQLPTTTRSELSLEDTISAGHPIMITTWSLSRVNITIPALHNYSHSSSILDITQDPVISTALTLFSFRDAVIDIQEATSVVFGLIVASLYPAIVAQLVLFFHVVLQIFTPFCGVRREEHQHSLYSPLLHSSLERLPSKAALLTTGILCIVSSVLISVGCILWVCRFVPDSQTIFYGLARLIGSSAVDWLRHNSHMDMQPGVFLTVLGLLFYVMSGAVALFTDLTPRYALIVPTDTLSSSYRLPYTPPHLHVNTNYQETQSPCQTA